MERRKKRKRRERKKIKKKRRKKRRKKVLMEISLITANCSKVAGGRYNFNRQFYPLLWAQGSWVRS